MRIRATQYAYAVNPSNQVNASSRTAASLSQIHSKRKSTQDSIRDKQEQIRKMQEELKDKLDSTSFFGSLAGWMFGSDQSASETRPEKKRNP